MALKFPKDKSWVCGEVIVRNLYGVPLNAAFKMFEVFRMTEDVTPLIESDKEKFKKPYTAPWSPVEQPESQRGFVMKKLLF